MRRSLPSLRFNSPPDPPVRGDRFAPIPSAREENEMTWLDELHDAKDRLRAIESYARDMANALHRVGLDALSQEAQHLSNQAREGVAALNRGIAGKLEDDNRTGAGMLGSIMSLAMEMDRRESSPERQTS